MKGYQRRALGKPTYYKVATWDGLAMCWKDGKHQFDSEKEARESVSRSGRYRISLVEDGKPRIDLEEFSI